MNKTNDDFLSSSLVVRGRGLASKAGLVAGRGGWVGQVQLDVFFCRQHRNSKLTTLYI